MDNQRMENIVEMARDFQYYQDHAEVYGLDFDGLDSRDLTTLIPQWAEEFDSAHPVGSYGELEDPHQKYIRDYYQDIGDFVLNKLRSGAVQGIAYYQTT